MYFQLHAVAAGAVAVLFAATAWTADHREAPRISEFPPADLNDIYAFAAPDADNRLVLVMTVNPLSVPEFAGTYAFSPDVIYRFTIDNTGDARADTRIDIRFEPVSAGRQTFSATFPGGLNVDGETTRPTVLSTEPNEPVIAPGPQGSGIDVFAGPRDDPFFFDGVGFTRFVNGAGTFTGDDSFAGLNVSAIVLRFPPDLVSGGNDLLQISGFTLRRDPDSFPASDFRLDRTGNPGVATAFIPGALRDEFNQGLPQHDARDFGDVILASLENFGTSPENIAILASVAVPDTLKLDLSQIDMDQPAAFPNGRALDDDVIDTLLTLVLNGPVGDGVDSNDKAFLETFPYLAPPFQAP